MSKKTLARKWVGKDSEAEWAMEQVAFGYANDATLPDGVRAIIRELWFQYNAAVDNIPTHNPEKEE